MAIRFCAKCKKVIKGDSVFLDGKHYHKDCIVCAYCGTKMDGSYVIHQGKIYHTECNPASGMTICVFCRKPIIGESLRLKNLYYHFDCYHNHIEKRCSICGKPIGSNSYYKDTWGNIAHVNHGANKTKFCFSCLRIIVRPSKTLGTDAILCDVCASTSVTTISQIEVCRSRVLSIFKSLGITGVPEDIPIELKPKDLMDDSLGRIRYIISENKAENDFRILIIYGLPELLFQGVLAHEMLHSWLVLYGRQVTDDEKEGFCNLGSGFIYQNTNTALAKQLLKRLYKNSDNIYGGGYRLQKERYEKLGWAGLLHSLRRIEE